LVISVSQKISQTGISNMKKQLTAVIEREGKGYVSFCPELDIASQEIPLRRLVKISGRHWNCFLKRHHEKKYSKGFMRKCV